MNVGILVRVSTETQVREGESLEDQEHDGRQWAAAHGHVVVAVFADPGLSGKLADRPGLLGALEALESRAIDALVVRDLDRLSRKLTVQEAVLARVWERPDSSVWEYAYNREVLRDDPDDPMRTAFRQVQGVFVELNAAMTVKKLRDGRKAKARKGGHANGPAPYGWRTEGGELHPIPAELSILDFIRQHKAAGLNQTAIAGTLNAYGLATRDGRPWSQQVVSRILQRDAARTPERIAYEAERRAA